VTCDILIRSYRKDLPWLERCLEGIARFCDGFRDVIVIVPRSSEAWLRRLPALVPNVRTELCPDYRDDYLGQQVTKLHADRFSDAELICHVDSDCLFERAVTPDDLLVDGRPRIVMRSYASLDRHWPWQAPTEQFLGWPVTHDFMQQPPFVYPRWLYGALREHAQTLHGVSIEDYVLSRPPRGFSEFNALGALAHRRYAEHFSWIDGEHGSVDGPCRWYWSWGDALPS
jgi:hypothetical protein